MTSPMLPDSTIRRHIETRIEHVEVKVEPCVHFIMDEVLPVATFDEMLKHWPGRNIGSEPGHVKQRRLYRLVPERMAGFPEDLKQFWNLMIPHFSYLNDLITRKFLPYADTKFAPFAGRDWRSKVDQELHFSKKFEAWLSVDVSDFNLYPHIDHPLLFNNSFFYCPEDNKHQDLGTVLYRGLGFMFPENVPIPTEMQKKYLKEEAQAPYRRNTLLSYLNTPHAFHGVRNISIPGFERKLVMFGRLLEKDTGRKIFGNLA